MSTDTRSLDCAVPPADLATTLPMPNARPRLVMLDRDGVINADSAAYVKSVAEWQPLPGAIAAIARLCEAGVQVTVCTNQSGVGRGLFALTELQAIHDALHRSLAGFGARLSLLSYCPHAPDAGCACRKPAPGMLRSQLDLLAIDARDACFIGDSRRDLEAAAAAGVTPLLVRTGNGEALATALRAGTAELTAAAHPRACYASLAEACQALVSLPPPSRLSEARPQTC